jgi:hypothetical protein
MAVVRVGEEDRVLELLRSFAAEERIFVLPKPASVRLSTIKRKPTAHRRHRRS